MIDEILNEIMLKAEFDEMLNETMFEFDALKLPSILIGPTIRI